MHMAFVRSAIGTTNHRPRMGFSPVLACDESRSVFIHSFALGVNICAERLSATTMESDKNCASRRVASSTRTNDSRSFSSIIDPNQRFAQTSRKRRAACAARDDQPVGTNFALT